MMMKPSDFHIGMEFWSDGGHWRCTDVGTRTIAAIKLDEHEKSWWYNGPPYAVAEYVLDEFGLETCYPTRELRDQHFPDLADTPHERRQALVRLLQRANKPLPPA
jgi:hypothetical protein